MSRTVLVTGSGSGIGQAIARQFHAQGDTVVIADVNAAAAEATAAELGERAIPITLDVTDEVAWASAVREVEQQSGPIEVLVNNAGVWDTTPVTGENLAGWRLSMEVNVFGPLLGIRAVVPGMRLAGGGSIVNIASTAGFRGVQGGQSYSTSKWAVRGLTYNAALDLAQWGIRVNTVVPGVVRTPLSKSAGYPERIPTQPVPETGVPEDLARVVVFVSASESRYINGAEYIVDGGSMAGAVKPQDV